MNKYYCKKCMKFMKKNKDFNCPDCNENLKYIGNCGECLNFQEFYDGIGTCDYKKNVRKDTIGCQNFL